MDDDGPVLLNLSDWNYEDKYFELQFSLLVEFSERIKAEGMSAAWSWFTPQVSYWQIDETWSQPDAPVKRVDHCANHMLDEFFIDWCNPVESVNDWGLDEDEGE